MVVEATAAVIPIALTAAVATHVAKKAIDATSGRKKTTKRARKRSRRKSSKKTKKKKKRRRLTGPERIMAEFRVKN